MISILAVCFESKEGDIAGNVGRAAGMIRDFAGKTHVDMAMLPEMFTCGYAGMDLTPWAEDEGSDTFRTFASLTKEIDAIIGWGFAGKGDARRVYNSYAVIEPGRAPAIVRKTHLHVSHPGQRINEPEFLLPGDRLGLVKTRLGTFGVMICYDGCFVEVPRTLVLSGADCVLWPTRSGGWLGGTGFARIRAIDNVVPIVMAEGSQTGQFPLASHTQIADQTGNLVAERKGEGLLLVQVDLDEVRRFRRTTVDALGLYRVRRPELYGPITEFRGVP